MTSKPGSFTPSLEYANSNVPSTNPAWAPAATAPNAPQPTHMTILEILARQVRRSLPIWDLQSLSGINATRFRDALKSLRALDYVAIDGDSLEEVIRLTDKGVEAASIAR
jgi:hypothetical protein